MGSGGGSYWVKEKCTTVLCKEFLDLPMLSDPDTRSRRHSRIRRCDIIRGQRTADIYDLDPARKLEAPPSAFPSACSHDAGMLFQIVWMLGGTMSSKVFWRGDDDTPRISEQARHQSRVCQIPNPYSEINVLRDGIGEII